MLYFFDLLGVAVFAASGVLAARHKQLDLLGVVAVAAITAIGGGTLRDLLLNRHPLFWIVDTHYLAVIIATGISTFAFLQFHPPPHNALLQADTLGLALFSLSGAQIAQSAQLAPLIVVLMGTMTGVAGGVLRDVLTAQVPLILQRDIYATAAMLGIVLYLTLEALAMPHTLAWGCGMATVVALRTFAIRKGLQLPTL